MAKTPQKEAAVEAPRAGAISTHLVLSPLMHDGVSYEPGDLLNLQADEAEKLIGEGVVEVTPELPGRPQ